MSQASLNTAAAAHRPLIALASSGSCQEAGTLSVRCTDGKPGHVRVVQEIEKQSSDVRKVRWVFSEGAETFQIELRHGRLTGLRKLYVNRSCIDDVRYTSNSDGCAQDFTLASRNGNVFHTARVLISKVPGAFEHSYQLLIDEQPIQLISKEDNALETPRTPRSVGSPRPSGCADALRT